MQPIRCPSRIGRRYASFCEGVPWLVDVYLAPGTDPAAIVTQHAAAGARTVEMAPERVRVEIGDGSALVAAARIDDVAYIDEAPELVLDNNEAPHYHTVAVYQPSTGWVSVVPKTPVKA